jgi:hypothetical protein
MVSMTYGDVLLVAALTFVGVGIVRDVTISDRVKGPTCGLFGGTLRPCSWRGFTAGLPWYLASAVLFGIVAWFV